MVKMKKTKGFSLVDAIIILSVVAIAVAVATPILTRKVVNIDDVMAFGHGRYEIYYKEIVSYDNSNYYEKAIGGNTNQIRVYERKTDSDYYKITGSAAKSDANGNKDTLYEEFNNVPVIRDSNGEIVRVKINGEEIPIGGRFIIESSDLVYYKYDKNGHKRLESGEKLPSDKRIIEGMLTTKYTKKPNHWIINATPANKNNFTGTVISEAFEKITSGSNTISEKYLKPDSSGKVSSSFDPGDNIQNAVVHAVGGGGAGGGVDKNSLGGSKSLKDLSPAELLKVKNELYENFKNSVPEIYEKGADAVIGTCKNCLDNESVWRAFANDSKKWLLLDTATGELIGKFDTTNPLSMILPDQVLNYTKEATTDTSVFNKYTMPKILTYKNIGSNFYTGSSVKSNSSGTKASSIEITVANDVDLPCMRTFYGYNGTFLDKVNKPTAAGKCTSTYTQYSYSYSTSTPYRYSTCDRFIPVGSCRGDFCQDYLNAAKIDYSNDIKFNSWIDKIKFYLDKNEIDLNYPIAHAGRTGECCVSNCSEIKQDFYGSCGKQECSCTISGSALSCSAVTSSIKCASGQKSKYKATKSSKYSSNEKCSAYECHAICNNFYYTCSKAQGALIKSEETNACGESFVVNAETCKDINTVYRNGDKKVTVKGGSGGAPGDRAYVCASPAKGIIAIQDIEQAPRSSNNPAKDQTYTITKATAHNAKLTFDNTYTWGNKGGNARRMIRVFSRENGSLLETHIATSNGGSPGQTYQQDTATLNITNSPAVSSILAMCNEISNKYHGEVNNEFEILSMADPAMISQYTSGLSDTEKSEFYNLLNNPGQVAGLKQAISDLQISAIGNGKMQSNAAYTENGNIGTTDPNRLYDQLDKRWQSTAEDGTFTYKNSDGTPLVTVNITPAPYDIVTTNNWVCGLQDGYSGKNGAKGTKSDDCANSLGIGPDDGIYNHIYAWVVPYRINTITYSQAGEAGEYKTAKVPRVTGPFNITLGKGGVWDNSWNSKTQGPNGGDTIVKMGKDRKGSSYNHVVTAKGGKGGSRSLLSNNYSLCFAEASTDANKGICYDSSGNAISCCQNEQGTRSSKDIIETAIKYSAIENVKSILGQSQLIGLGIGRGAEAAGSRAGKEMVAGSMKIYNISYSASCGTACSSKRVVYSKGNTTATNDDYKNTAIKPSSLNFKGGDGAVIITW